MTDEPQPPEDPPPSDGRLGHAWVWWVLCSAGLPAVSCLSKRWEIITVVGVFSAVLGMICSFNLGSILAGPARPERSLGLSILFAMGSCGVVLSIVYSGCLVYFKI